MQIPPIIRHRKEERGISPGMKKAGLRATGYSRDLLSRKHSDYCFFHFVSDTAENGHNLFFRAANHGRIGKTEMNQSNPAEKEGTLFVCVTAQGDYIIEIPLCKRIQIL